jgi:hypothetical protein
VAVGQSNFEEISMLQVIRVAFVASAFAVATIALAQTEKGEILESAGFGRIPKGDVGLILKPMLGGSDVAYIEYDHPRSVSEFGKVFFHLNFATGESEAGNKKGAYKGRFWTVENLLCSVNGSFGTTCFFVNRKSADTTDGLSITFLQMQERHFDATAQKKN